MTSRRFQLTLLTLAAGMALTGCSAASSGSGTSASSHSVATSASSSVATSSAVTSPVSNPSTSSPAAVTSTPPGAKSIPQCLSDIRVIPGESQGAAGHLALVLVFNNVSTTQTCEITGYPGVDLVTPSGVAVAHLTRTLRGMAGGEPVGVTAPQPVVLRPGASASALAEASDVPQGGIANCGNYALLITVPNQYASVGGGTAMLPRCNAQIHPVVPGTTGGLG